MFEELVPPTEEDTEDRIEFFFVLPEIEISIKLDQPDHLIKFNLHHL